MSAEPSSRIKSYKNKALDSLELRRRREEEGIQLRKQKRDEQVGKQTHLNRSYEVKNTIKLKLFIYNLHCCV